MHNVAFPGVHQSGVASAWRTHAVAMVLQIGGIGRPGKGAGVGWLRDEMTDISRTLRPM
jgi:hypothetical protein